ncbi:hypothetical protein V1264_015268 [Littorina saxatilis]|uniref:Ankyrin repeat protein n=2 Tax=Littorina saxatilis TaxID=31220 RepID=A0AAN9BLC0_9CAEN
MSSDDVTDSHITTLLDDIKLNVDTEMFKRHLEKCSRRKLETWRDKDDLDLMHHAIMESNFVVVGNFFALGFFKPPHEVMTSWLYVHVAAVLGQRTIVSMLLQERPYDNRKVVLDWPLFHRAIAPKLDVSKVTTSIVPTEEKEKTFAFLPLDLAARYGHVQSVKTILDFHIFRAHQSQGGVAYIRSSVAKTTGHMNMACLLDSPFALRLLLTDKPEAEDAKNALDISLKKAKPECVDALLRFGVDTKRLFGGMNLFHVLFAYSKSFEESWFESFVTVTSVLLRHHHDVNECRPSRTYPLYSLLRCTRIAKMKNSAPFVIAALLLLLQGGADPNFDERFVEEAVRDKEHNTAFGRQPYPSALHCLIDAAVNYMEEVTDAEHVIKYVYKCSELLLRHGADASYVGKYRDASGEERERRGNVLHVLCDAAPHLGRMDNTLLLLLLRHGADPDACVDGRFPLTSYLDAMFGGFEALESDSHEKQVSPAVRSPRSVGSPALQRRGNSTSTLTNRPAADDVSDDAELITDVRRMCRMLGFMSLKNQNICANIVRARLTSQAGESTDVNRGLKRALEEMEKYTLTAPSLRRCCAMLVWRHCRRHVGNVYALPVPKPLINVVMNNL